jgi:hypothetical protein
LGEVITVNGANTAPYPYGVRFESTPGIKRRQAFSEDELEPGKSTEVVDNVNHPSHYTWLPNGLEVIDLIEHLMTNRGNAVKYLCRAGRKNPDTELEDLRKAAWYVEREIKRITKEKNRG